MSSYKRKKRSYSAAEAVAILQQEEPVGSKRKAMSKELKGQGTSQLV
jgi:hypothetical protein